MAKTLEDLAQQMTQFQQSENENLLEHGQAVAKALHTIVEALSGGPQGNLFIPDIVIQNAPRILEEL